MMSVTESCCFSMRYLCRASSLGLIRLLISRFGTERRMAGTRRHGGECDEGGCPDLVCGLSIHTSPPSGRDGRSHTRIRIASWMQVQLALVHLAALELDGHVLDAEQAHRIVHVLQDVLVL